MVANGGAAAPREARTPLMVRMAVSVHTLRKAGGNISGGAAGAGVVAPRAGDDGPFFFGGGPGGGGGGAVGRIVIIASPLWVALRAPCFRNRHRALIAIAAVKRGRCRKNDASVKRVALRSPGGGQLAGLSTFAVPLCSWAHVAATCNSTTDEKQVWQDGVMLESQTTLGTASDNGPLVIGADDDSGDFDSFSVGVIDDVRIYDRVITAEEITALATCGTSRPRRSQRLWQAGVERIPSPCSSEWFSVLRRSHRPHEESVQRLHDWRARSLRRRLS